ncbi:MAG: futalosine hydrolase [Desulfamplus sp.]|nr:futalosine hydrolase [Desulfamplus sp.]
MHYLILVATPMEINPLLSRSTVLSESITPSGVRIISASLGKKDFKVVVTGPGVINTAHGLTVYLEHYIDNSKEHQSSLLIIQTGIAGYFKDSGLEMGDIAVATSETYIHTGVNREISSFSSSCSSYPYDPLPFDLVPDCPMSRQGHFEFDCNMIQKSCSIIEKGLTDLSFTATSLNAVNPLTAVNSEIATNFEIAVNSETAVNSKRVTNFRAATNFSTEINQSQSISFSLMTGNFITVSAITSTTEHADKLFRAFDYPCMESMEGAASAHIAALYNIPFLEIRAGSNPVGIRDKKQWDIPLACQNASFALEALLEKGELF